MKTIVSITLDKGLINRLKEIAKEEDRSLSAVLRIAGREYVAGFNKPSLKGSEK